MKNSKNTREGYVLVLTIMILSIIVIIVTQLANRGIVHLYFDKIMLEKEQAKKLALSGVNIALSQLTQTIASSKDSPKDATKKQNPDTLLLETAIPTLNQWQEFPLKEEVDGVDGIIKIALCCEDGKINLNKIFDFQQKKFLGEKQEIKSTDQKKSAEKEQTSNDAKKILQEIFGNMKKFTQDKNLFDPLEKFLKQREFPLNDPSELLEIPEFAQAFKQSVFYVPPEKNASAKRSIYLMDIFTVCSNHATLQPWFLSDSIAALYNLKRVESGEQEKRKQYVKDMFSTFTGFKQSVEQVWDKQLKFFYTKDFKSISQTTKQLLAPVEPRVFSVLSYGVVGNITQKIFAILEKNSQDKTETFVIKKLYWI